MQDLTVDVSARPWTACIWRLYQISSGTPSVSKGAMEVCRTTRVFACRRSAACGELDETSVLRRAVAGPHHSFDFQSLRSETTGQTVMS